MSPPAGPRLGFLGLGWIGRRRLRGLVEAGACRAVALADPSPAALAEARAIAPEARPCASMEELLTEALDGLVIATPSGQHADQALAALSRGVPVFCQKPLARTGAETREVIEAARNRDRLLAVDFSYRPALAFERVIAAVREERLGRVYSVDLVFHNAYGPDKGWSKDRTLAGGGCLIDLGVHLLDMAMLALGAPRVSKVHAALFASGEPLRTLGEIEDFAQASFETETGANVRIACSWWLHAGQDAIIEAIFRGTQGAATVHNVNGSFFDFVAELSRGTSREVLASPPDDWEARAVKAWAGRLARSNTFDPSVESAAVVAELIDRIYAA